MASKSKQTAPFDSVADAVAYTLECKDHDHFPYSLELNGAQGEPRFVHAWVRTTSWDWDGCGGRTDLHEIFASLWAAVLRANGVASASLVDYEGWGGSNEIYSRALIVRQPFNVFLKDSETDYFQRIQAHTAWASHHLREAFSLEDLQESEPKWQSESLPWLEAIRSHLGSNLEDELFVERTNPVWRYYKASSYMTLLELPPAGGLLLRKAFCFYQPQTTVLGARLIVSAGGIHNAISIQALKKAEKLLQVIDTSDYIHFVSGDTQFDQPGLLIIPVESHCVLIGGSAAVILRTNCGYEAFLKAREAWHGPGRRAAAIFGQSGTFVWASHVDSGRFADLAEELLVAEPAVVRVRNAGPHTERDQGRDLIADWLRIVDAGSSPPKLRTDTILVQVKSRGRTIGKADVRDVRDTIERHEADGYLLIGYPQFSGDLINYLEALRQRGQSIEWWSRAQLEERLRRNLDIATRFQDIVRYCPPEDGSPEGWPLPHRR